MIQNNKFIIAYILLKALALVIYIQYFDQIFLQSFFRYDDYVYYTNEAGLGIGPNQGFVWLIRLLGIQSIQELLPISLAFALNTLIDLKWISLLKKHLDFPGQYFLLLALALHPYASLYTLKFTSIIFAKIGVIYLFITLTKSNTKTKTSEEAPYNILFWTFISFIRNSNVMLALPYFLFCSRVKFFYKTIVISFVVLLLFYATGEYIQGVRPDRWPWTVTYVANIFHIDNIIILYFVTFLLRVLILFGGREMLFTNGVEPFVTNSFGLIEMFAYFFIGLFQLIGFIFSLRFFSSKFSKKILIIAVPLIIASVTVGHQRYLLPYIPLALFGLAYILQETLLKLQKKSSNSK